MISKKLATTLGTGTLGAGGAAGTAAWKLGLLGDKTLSSSDIKAIGSSNWKTEKKTESEIAIKIEEGEELWQCTIKGFIFNGDKNKSKIEEQVKELVAKINADETKRNIFVKNCADARLTNEKGAGKDSTIELEVEVESDGNLKLKDLDNLLNGDFIGLGRFEKDYQLDYEEAEEWTFDVKKEDKRPVVKLSKGLESGTTFCSIYGNNEETFDANKFDYGALSTIFTAYSGGQNNPVNFEKRKFLIRNCSANNKRLEGMKVVFDSSTQKWKFENLEELLTKMYKNPTVEKP